MGAFCKENKDNTKLYFKQYFQDLRDIMRDGSECDGKMWLFDFLICTDLKAHWALLDVGGGNSSTYARLLS